MAEFLRDLWYCAGHAEEVAETPLARRICDEPIVFYRGAGGTIAALQDRCPHRFVPLSRGKVEGSTLRCGYHGVAFGPDGACVDNPCDREHAIPPKLRVTAYPVVERHTFLWVWIGDPARADPSLIPDCSHLDDPTLATVRGHLVMQAHHMLVSDNLLDLTHVDFLHPTIRPTGTSPDQYQTKVEIEGNRVWSRMLRPNVFPTGIHARMMGWAPGTRVDNCGDSRWDPPSNIVVFTELALPGQLGQPGSLRVPNCHMLTPQTGRSTHYFYTASRSALQDDREFDAMLGPLVHRIFSTEDGPMIEAQQAAMGDSVDFLDHDPVILKADAAGIAARRIMKRLLKAQAAKLRDAAAE